MEPDRANLEAETARQVLDFLEGLFKVSDEWAAHDMATWRKEISPIELLDKGADPAIQEKIKGMNPLMAASETGKTEVAKLLLERGAKVNAADNQGRTALMWASLNGRHEVVKLLLANKADLTIRDREGQTALSLAQSSLANDTVEMLQKAGAPSGTTKESLQEEVSTTPAPGKTGK